MTFDMTHLDALKQQLIAAQDFKQIWDYFFDHCAENSDFLDRGERVSHPDLEHTLSKVAQQLLDAPDAQLSNLLLIKVAGYDFYHGAFFMGSRLVNVMFFADIDAGTLAIAPAPGSAQVVFGRFSLLEGHHRVSVPPSVN